MSRKIIFLVNPVSGTKGKSSFKTRLFRYMEGRNIPFEVVDTAASGDYGPLKERIINEKITDVVVCGGDGSVNAVCAGLTGVDVNTGIIPLGSGNGLAFCAGIPKGTNAALDLILKGETAYADGIYINGKFSCMLCGIGFDAEVAHAFSRHKKRGLGSYIKLSLKHFFKCRTYPFTLITPEKTVTVDAYFLSIANSNQFGNNFTIAPKASLTDGLADIIVVKKMNRFRLPFAVLKQISGYNARRNLKDIHKNTQVLYFQTPSLTIINSGFAPMHIDGEPVPAEEKLEIKIIKNAIRLIQPG